MHNGRLWPMSVALTSYCGLRRPCLPPAHRHYEPHQAVSQNGGPDLCEDILSQGWLK